MTAIRFIFPPSDSAPRDISAQDAMILSGVLLVVVVIIIVALWDR